MNKLDEAFQTVARADFLTPLTRSGQHIDAPIPIGHGQTSSQPSTVRLMFKWLDPQPGEKILDVGSGSGWTAGLLSHLVGPKGRVYAVEKIPELLEFGQYNANRAGVKRVTFYLASDKLGLPEFAPYDRILVSAAATKLPGELLSQLKVGGRMVIPVRNSIYIIDKTSKDKHKSTAHSGFVFVPLV